MMNATLIKTKEAASRCDMAIAAVIKQQLGGTRFELMTGARNFIARRVGANGMAGGLFFALPTRGSLPNRVEICLTYADDYSVYFYRSVRGSLKTVKVVNGVLAENLREVFRNATQLEVSL